ncbi:MAG: CPBP family intramembrane glutamic endopeptidase [Candidatus Nanopelagicales bacterium]|nr:CPBP family intramembrane metalloprotease [Actinomycetota bacterium]
MTVTAPPTRDDRGLRGFMNRGGAWRFLAFMVGYLVIYLGFGQLMLRISGNLASDPLLDSVGTVFVQLTAGLILGAVILVSVMLYLGWAPELFGRQPIYRSWWMWLGPVIVATPILLRIFGIDWGKNPVPVVILALATGLLIGFVEELLYRGFAVKMLRDAGHGEWVVAALSSLFFALSHSVNLFSGQSIKTVGPTVIYTFGFGVLMYLSLRSISFLVGAMILHGLTDPTTFLASGGIDVLTEGGSSNALLNAAGLATFVVTFGGIVLLAFVRGRVPKDDEGQPGTPATA